MIRTFQIKRIPAACAITVFAAAVFLLPERSAAQIPPQAQHESLRGIVSVAGTSEVVPGADITIRPKTGGATVDMTPILQRLSSIVGAPVNQLEALVASTPQAFQSTIDSLRAQGALPEAVDLLVQAQSMRGAGAPFMQVTADAAGRFAMNDVPPGAYTLTVRADGFFGPRGDNGDQPDFVSQPVTVVAQPATADLSISLISGGVITGTIRDSSGRPLPRVSVQAFPAAALGESSGPRAAATRITNDRGEYRLFWLKPGPYILAVSPPGPSASGPVSAGSQERMIQTFYGDVTDIGASAPLTLKPGEELRGMNITARTLTRSVGNTLDGKWDAQIAGQHLELNLKLEGASVTGMMGRDEIPAQTVPISGGTFDNGTVSFTVTSPDGARKIRFEGKLTGDTITFMREVTGDGPATGTGIYGINGPRSVTVRRVD